MDLTIPVAVFESKDDNRPARYDLSWDSLAERLCRYDERMVKDGRAWSPVTYRPGTTRGKDNVEQVHALVLDIDHNELPVHLLNGLEYVAHTTFSHSDDDPRWRVVLPLTRPVEGEDWPNFWLRANAYFGGCVDPQTKDRSRIFYLPSCMPGATHESKQQHGLLLDPSSLPDVPQYQPPELVSRRNGAIHTVADDGLTQWAQRFAAAKLDELAAMPPHTGRNAACNRAAFLLAGMVADGRHGIETSWVEQQLFDACQRNNLVFEDGERSVRATIASGVNAGLNRPWSPADRDDGWTPSPQLVISKNVDPITGEVTDVSPWRTLAEVVAAAPERGRQLAEGILWEMRTHWVYSGPGAGKTLLWLAILMHIADSTKDEFCGHKLEHGPVLLIEEDSPDSVISEYCEMLADIYDIDLATIPFLTNRIKGVRLMDDAGRLAVQNMILQAPWTPLILALDACERLVPSDRFSSRELEPLSRLLQWSLELRMTNVMIDHTRKPVTSSDPIDPIDTLYGGRTKSAISDVMMHLSGTIRDQAVLTFPKFRGVEPTPISIRFDGAKGFTLDSGKPKLSESERLVMREITNNFGKPLTKNAIAEGVKLSDRTTQRALSRLIELGWVERSGATSDSLFTAASRAPGMFS